MAFLATSSETATDARGRPSTDCVGPFHDLKIRKGEAGSLVHLVRSCGLRSATDEWKLNDEKVSSLVATNLCTALTSSLIDANRATAFGRRSYATNVHHVHIDSL